jgi:membrane-associated phospholipid phosphatase
MKKLLSKFSIVDWVNISFWLIIFIFYLLVFNKTSWKYELMIIYPVLLGFVFLTAWYRERYRDYNHMMVMMIVFAVIFFFSMFQTLFMILPYLNPAVYDQLMVDIDHAILGVHPTLWMEQFISRWLTELMYILYFVYFPMPLITLILMYRKGMYTEMEKSMVMLLVCYYSAYITYFIVPVNGPRFFLADLHSIELTGYFLSQPIYDLIDVLETNKFDCFPSLHTALLLVVMYISYRYTRTLYYIYVPIAIGILISLIYLRYHYFIDVLAGVVFAIASVIFSEWLHNKYHKRFTFHFGENNR